MPVATKKRAKRKSAAPNTGGKLSHAEPDYRGISDARVFTATDSDERKGFISVFDKENSQFLQMLSLLFKHLDYKLMAALANNNPHGYSKQLLQRNANVLDAIDLLGFILFNIRYYDKLYAFIERTTKGSFLLQMQLQEHFTGNKGRMTVPRTLFDSKIKEIYRPTTSPSIHKHPSLQVTPIPRKVIESGDEASIRKQQESFKKGMERIQPSLKQHEEERMNMPKLRDLQREYGALKTEELLHVKYLTPTSRPKPPPREWNNGDGRLFYDDNYYYIYPSKLVSVQLEIVNSPTKSLKTPEQITPGIQGENTLFRAATELFKTYSRIIQDMKREREENKSSLQAAFEQADKLSQRINVADLEAGLQLGGEAIKLQSQRLSDKIADTYDYYTNPNQTRNKFINSMKRKVKTNAGALASVASNKVIRDAAVREVNEHLASQHERFDTGVPIQVLSRSSTKSAAPNPWIAHLNKYRSSHPGVPLKQCMTDARKTYKRGGGARCAHDKTAQRKKTGAATNRRKTAPKK